MGKFHRFRERGAEVKRVGRTARQRFMENREGELEEIEFDIWAYSNAAGQ